jgi:hypothetical protein
MRAMKSLRCGVWKLVPVNRGHGPLLQPNTFSWFPGVPKGREKLS